MKVDPKLCPTSRRGPCDSTVQSRTEGKTQLLGQIIDPKGTLQRIKNTQKMARRWVGKGQTGKDLEVAITVLVKKAA